MQTSSGTYTSSRLLNALLLAASLLVAAALGEGMLRFFFEDRLAIREEERALLYRYDEKLGWFPRVNSTYQFTGGRTITVSHNNRGFRDREHVPHTKPGIMFIGDSFVWGYDVEASDRFTDKLQVRLPEWDVFNMGVSGYGTDQEFLLLMDQFDHYRPRIVFLIFCTYNDEGDNSTNSIFDGMYYKPYYAIDKGMALMGTPVPRSLSYFALQHPILAKSYLIRLLVKATSPPLVAVENPTRMILHRMKQFTDQRGARLMVGLVDPHGFLQSFLYAEGIPYLRLDGAERFPSHGWHWTPTGHTTVSDAIYRFLRDGGYLEDTGRAH